MPTLASEKEWHIGQVFIGYLGVVALVRHNFAIIIPLARSTTTIVLRTACGLTDS
jgi:hypothetical protein